MTRTLYLVRHAKAEDRSATGRDHDRELISEGFTAAARMGRHLHTQGVRPDCILSSTANRARDTARVVAEQLGIDPNLIQFSDHLFDGGPMAYQKAVHSLPNDCAAAMLVGHNPDISYFGEYLTHEAIGSMSKGAVTAVTFSELSWAEVAARTGKLAFYIAPKQLL